MYVQNYFNQIVSWRRKLFLFCQENIFKTFQQRDSIIKINQVNNYRAIQRKNEINWIKSLKILEETRENINLTKCLKSKNKLKGRNLKKKKEYNKNIYKT